MARSKEALGDQDITVRGTRFDFAEGPEPSVPQHNDSMTRLPRARAAETEGLANLQALLERNADAGLPLCVGPVLLHEDGVAECYACSDPMNRLHPGGHSASCTQGREFGEGHRCTRCAPSATPHRRRYRTEEQAPSDQTEHTKHAPRSRL